MVQIKSRIYTYICFFQINQSYILWTLYWYFESLWLWTCFDMQISSWCFHSPLARRIPTKNSRTYVALELRLQVDNTTKKRSNYSTTRLYSRLSLLDYITYTVQNTIPRLETLILQIDPTGNRTMVFFFQCSPRSSKTNENQKTTAII